jgi:hypothetical protein
VHTFSSDVEARVWLGSIGGEIRGPSAVGDDFGEAVTAFVPGFQLSRTAYIPHGLRGAARDAAYREAVREACRDLRDAGAEQMARGARFPRL